MVFPQRFGVVFLMGLCTNNEMQEALLNENSRYNDLLQARVSDDYRTLPAKVLSAYQWFYWEWRNRSDFYSFTDDDYFLNLPRIFDCLTSNREDFIKNKTILCGFTFNAFGTPAR